MHLRCCRLKNGIKPIWSHGSGLKAKYIRLSRNYSIMILDSRGMIYRITRKEELLIGYLCLAEMLQSLLNLRKSIIENEIY